MPPHYNHTNKTSRLNIHISHRRDPRSQSEFSKVDGDRDHDDDQDGVGDDDDDGKEFGDPDDPTLYCYCRKMSYGEVSYLFSTMSSYLVLCRWSAATTRNALINGSI